MPVDLNALAEGWLELESDPGLFTLLLEDFGVEGVKVEEVYDLSKPIEGSVYGFIYLFPWNPTEERRSRRGKEETVSEEVTNSIFFAKQQVSDSCATHALISVILNVNSPELRLGETLDRFKDDTKGWSPEDKGWAISNIPKLAKAHNWHATPTQSRNQDGGNKGPTLGRCTAETYHYVTFVPINGRLIELDGLKQYPIDHGPYGKEEEWTAYFLRHINERWGSGLKYNLMSVVPDTLKKEREALEEKKKLTTLNKDCVIQSLQMLVREKKLEEEKKKSDPNTVITTGEGDHGEWLLRYPEIYKERRLIPKVNPLLCLLRNVDKEISDIDAMLESLDAKEKEQKEIRRGYTIDDCRRSHDYTKFIVSFLSMLAERGKLADLVERELHPTPTGKTATSRFSTLPSDSGAGPSKKPRNVRPGRKKKT